MINLTFNPFANERKKGKNIMPTNTCFTVLDIFLCSCLLIRFLTFF